MSALKSFQPVVLSVLRIVTAYLFLLHGTAKFFSFPMSMGGAPEGLMLVAGVLEIVGSILLILGLFTVRPRLFCPVRWQLPTLWRTRLLVMFCFHWPTRVNLPFCSASCFCTWQ